MEGCYIFRFKGCLTLVGRPQEEVLEDGLDERIPTPWKYQCTVGNHMSLDEANKALCHRRDECWR